MLLDARGIPSGEVLEADLCVVGGGPAGITVALALKERAIKVVLLESGGMSPDDDAQALNCGTATGHEYYALDACRLRGLGGSTNFWGGWCRPLDDEDFEERDWVPHSGWPIAKSDLVPYYARAQRVCRLGPYEYDVDGWNGDAQRRSGAEPAALTDTMFQVGPTRFGIEYRRELERASNVTLVMHANATELEMDATSRRVARVRAATLCGGRFDVAASVFVLAAGGIENPRLLLASRHERRGVGNEHDLVGRFFADHLHVAVGMLQPINGASAFYAERQTRGVRVRGGMSLSAGVRRRKRLYGCGLTLHNCDNPHDVLRPTRMPDGYESLRLLMKSVRRRQRPRRVWRHLANVVTGLDTAAALAYRKVVTPRVRALTVGCRAEQAPNPDSRVTLDDTKDRFGVPRARLHWQVSAGDIETLTEVQKLWPRELSRLGRVEPFPTEGDGWLDRVAAGAHHTGTTRMHRDPRRGVVDEHCRVHGTSNLYVAGSSVFPTAGWAPPTLTIVALALRLADHLRTRPAT
jgi:choline dehydrogenase-like flavoprotein